MLSACLLAACDKEQPSIPEPESASPQIHPVLSSGTPVDDGSHSSDTTDLHARGWMSDVERRAKLPPDEYRKQQEERRQKVEEALADVSDVPLPPEAHDFGRKTCRLEPGLLREFYQRLHNSIDFNDFGKWQIKVDGSSSGSLDIKVDGVRFPQDCKFIVLQPRVVPRKYAAWEQVEYVFRFNFEDGLLYAEVDPSDD